MEPKLTVKAFAVTFSMLLLLQPLSSRVKQTVIPYYVKDTSCFPLLFWI
jgi:hypothetical protein